MPKSSASFFLEFRRRVVLPVVSVIVFGFVLAAALLWQLAAAQDQDELARSQQFIRRSLEQRAQAMSSTLKDYAAWGAAYRNLHVKLDTAWAYDQENVGPPLYSGFKYDYVFLVAPGGRIVYGVLEGQLAEPAAMPALGGGFQLLVDKAGAVAPNETVPVTGLLDVAGRPVLAGAAALSTGSDPSVSAIPGPPSILVFGARLSDDALAALGEQWFVPRLRLAGDAADAAAPPHLALPTTDGRITHTLRWTPDQPGRAMLWRVFPGLALAAAALAGFVILVVQHAAKAASTISEGASRLADAEEQMRHLALHDAVTGLPNRASLSRHLQEMLATGRRVCLLSIDLDRFKPINDSLGHRAGDVVLGEVAHRLRKLVHEHDLAARLGGDEFAAALLDRTDDEVERFCQRLQRDLAAPIVHEGCELSVGASIGIALSPGDARSAEELLRVADLALYQAKRDGFGTYRFYAPEMNEHIASRRVLEADLRRALQRGEFVLHYQPRFDAHSMRITSAEALVRWLAPSGGLVRPAEFIPLAEEIGLIVPLGEWVLHTACAAAVQWGTIGVSVNVSPAQVRSGDLTATVERALRETGLSPDRLELELTEGVLLEDTDRARDTLAALKRLGVRLALDDFGTGYSSLGYIRRFPFDAIKIDKQFVADMATTRGSRAIVQSILGLGKALGMSVTAEGVETAEQLMLLRLDGCDEVQGFYASPPRDQAVIAGLVQAQAPAAAGGPPPPLEHTHRASA
ncbi:putative bifunctional diguanylate cyclase/phosphodiesterase [Labrys wisconsinensis]|uniref:Diguanylate cyclase (GGDEF)-like protein n=1 Tax=Labrys wisconsinensis TaxID=425677 RepID=A0ABU0JNX5_9HYPH|nr:EAL domain-containing protein [Labrys wisconsinensis]MDQ0474989.1 diguanylate cyclase (GGDEF)-like protein [Labrys wisconsinensis]